MSSPSRQYGTVAVRVEKRKQLRSPLPSLPRSVHALSLSHSLSPHMHLALAAAGLLATFAVHGAMAASVVNDFTQR